MGSKKNIELGVFFPKEKTPYFMLSRGSPVCAPVGDNVFGVFKVIGLEGFYEE